MSEYRLTGCDECCGPLGSGSGTLRVPCLDGKTLPRRLWVTVDGTAGPGLGASFWTCNNAFPTGFPPFTFPIDYDDATAEWRGSAPAAFCGFDFSASARIEPDQTAGACSAAGWSHQGYVLAVGYWTNCTDSGFGIGGTFPATDYHADPLPSNQATDCRNCDLAEAAAGTTTFGGFQSPPTCGCDSHGGVVGRCEGTITVST